MVYFLQAAFCLNFNVLFNNSFWGVYAFMPDISLFVLTLGYLESHVGFYCFSTW